MHRESDQHAQFPRGSAQLYKFHRSVTSNSIEIAIKEVKALEKKKCERDQTNENQFDIYTVRYKSLQK